MVRRNVERRLAAYFRRHANLAPGTFREVQLQPKMLSGFTLERTDMTPEVRTDFRLFAYWGLCAAFGALFVNYLLRIKRNAVREFVRRSLVTAHHALTAG